MNSFFEIEGVINIYKYFGCGYPGPPAQLSKILFTPR
jgi:hypothetical protein